MELVTRSTLSGRAGIVPNQPGGRHAPSARLRQSQVGRAAGREDPAQIPVPAQPAPGYMMNLQRVYQYRVYCGYLWGKREHSQHPIHTRNDPETYVCERHKPMWIFLIGVQPEQRRAHLWAANVPGGSQRQDHRLRRRRHRRMGPGCFGYVEGLQQFVQIHTTVIQRCQ